MSYTTVALGLWQNTKDEHNFLRGAANLWWLLWLSHRIKVLWPNWTESTQRPKHANTIKTSDRIVIWDELGAWIKGHEPCFILFEILCLDKRKIRLALYNERVQFVLKTGSIKRTAALKEHSADSIHAVQLTHHGEDYSACENSCIVSTGASREHSSSSTK